MSEEQEYQLDDAFDGVKEAIIRKLALSLGFHPGVLRKVVDNQFKTVELATRDPTIMSVEVAGFGKFLFSQARSAKRLHYYELAVERYKVELSDSTLSPRKREIVTAKMAQLEKDIIQLKLRRDEFERRK